MLAFTTPCCRPWLGAWHLPHPGPFGCFLPPPLPWIHPVLSRASHQAPFKEEEELEPVKKNNTQSQEWASSRLKNSVFFSRSHFTPCIYVEEECSVMGLPIGIAMWEWLNDHCILKSLRQVGTHMLSVSLSDFCSPCSRSVTFNLGLLCIYNVLLSIIIQKKYTNASPVYVHRPKCFWLDQVSQRWPWVASSIYVWKHANAMGTSSVF